MTEPSAAEPKELRNGRYRLVRVLGEGGQGQTFEAIDNGMLRAPAKSAPLTDQWERYVERARGGESRDSRGRVAIKCFRVGTAKVWKDVELAEREARTLASLDHPRLPKYIEHFEENGSLYLVMEKIEGESLAELRRKRSLSTDEVLKMLEDVGEALRYLHGRAPFIVHRDIKPGNIIRRPDGSYALVDFGAVRDRLKPAGGSTVVGTFGYMAPEQFQGRASPKSDLYGLGATALTLLTGTEPEELPHEGLGIDVGRALPRSTPAPLVRALTAMLVADPDRRASSIEEALAYLRAPQRSERPRSQRPQKSAPAPRGEEPKLSRKEKRELKKQERHARREENKRRRREARARRAPIVPFLVAKLGLFVATLVVWLTVGLVVPLFLTILSLVFGGALRRAAAACVRAARRAHARMGNASAWMSGYRDGAETGGEQPPRLRVGTELGAVRSVTQREAQAIAIKEAAEMKRLLDASWTQDDSAVDEEREEERQRLLQQRLPLPPPTAKRRP